MPNGKFYTHNLRELVKRYLDAQAWLSVFRDAEYDERRYPDTSSFTYGLDYCDLRPYMKREYMDSVYQVSRAEMVDKLSRDGFATPKLMIPPGTLIEYVQGVVHETKALQQFLWEFDRLKSCRSNEEFISRLGPMYEIARRIIEKGGSTAELTRLEKAVQEGTLLTIETAFPSPADRKKIVNCPATPDPQSYDYLVRRRRDRMQDYELACRIDVANMDLFLAANSALDTDGTNFVMTTTGNLTLDAFRKSAPWMRPHEAPCRHLATPYLRQMVRQGEPASGTRVNKIRTGVDLLQEMIHEIETIEEAFAVLHARVDGIDPDAKVIISKRLVDATISWRDLVYLPYLKGLDDEASAQITFGVQPGDMSEMLDWTRDHLHEIEHNANGAPKSTRKSLAEMGGFLDDDIRERFVPEHRDAMRIIEWLEAHS